MSQASDSSSPEDICARSIRNETIRSATTQPHSTPIYLSSVYECNSPTETDAMLGGSQAGYVYSRDGHPNATNLAEKCRQLHRAERAVVTSSGMSAMALALVTQCQSGDHVILSKHLYGRTATLFGNEAARFGITTTLVDTFDEAAIEKAWQPTTKLLVVESITNPMLRISDIPRLAELCKKRSCKLLVDNTLASPLNCRPFDHGADLVLESLTKIMNGHSDVCLGLLCGSTKCWDRVPSALSTWGWTSPPFECWLADRGLATLAVRWNAAADNARAVAEDLKSSRLVKAVHYAGLTDHVDYNLARKIFTPESLATHSSSKSVRSGTLVSFIVPGGWDGAARFIAAVRDSIPFCPSLGELNTTLSHPASTSHRAFSPADRAALGIDDGTIRLSVGIESSSTILANLAAGLLAASN